MTDDEMKAAMAFIMGPTEPPPRPDDFTPQEELHEMTCQKCGKTVGTINFHRPSAKLMTPDEIRQWYPRQGFVCECGFQCVYYASFAHYIMGDY